MLDKHVTVDQTCKVAISLNCEIASETMFDRKHYFYPDNPKAYQISQDEMPIGKNGWIDIEVDGKKKRIGITRLHLEEDMGKLEHADGYSLVDYNRQIGRASCRRTEKRHEGT